LRLAALIVDGWIEEAAIFAAMQVGVALRTGIVLQDLLAGKHLDWLPAVEAGEGHVRHSRILPQCCARLRARHPDGRRAEADSVAMQIAGDAVREEAATQGT
jgi:hypothetical protein